MGQPLLIVAASGLAREVLELVRRGHRYEPVGILDDNPALAGTTIDDLPVLGGLDVAHEHHDAAVVLCAGRGAARNAIVDRLATAGFDPGRYARVIHPGVEVPPSATIGAGSILLAGVVLTTRVAIGSHVVVMPNVTLTHDNVLGDYATITAGVSLGGWVDVGPRAYLGMNSSARERVRIGADAVVGMGAAVVTDVGAGTTVVGVPARVLARSTPTTSTPTTSTPTGTDSHDQPVHTAR